MKKYLPFLCMLFYITCFSLEQNLMINDIEQGWLVAVNDYEKDGFYDVKVVLDGTHSMSLNEIEKESKM